MPANILSGWSASSLTPVARATVNNANMASPAASPTVQNLLNNAAQANPYGSTQVSGATNNLLAAIYGPNYQSLLQSRTVGDGDGADSDFQKQMANFLREKTQVLRSARSMADAAVFNPDEAYRRVPVTSLGVGDAQSRRQIEGYRERNRSIQAALPFMSQVGAMAAYTPNLGGGQQSQQAPMTSGWTPGGMTWVPQKQPSAATQAGMALTGMQRPNYAQDIVRAEGVSGRVPGINRGGNIGVASTWQSRLMAQGV